MADAAHGSSSALSPSVLAAIDDLELIARIVIEGLRTGGNRSPFHGFTTEFRQHRPYRAGDDLKYLDWKLFARSDRLYTRQFRETTNLSVMLVLDTSASMAFPETGLSKFRYATILAASLAYLVSEQGNAVGLMTMRNGKLAYVPARGGRQHLLSLIATIDRLTPEGSFDAARVISRGAQLLQRRGVVVAISDFYDAEEATQRELRHIVQHGHDVAMLQVVAPDELALSASGQVELEDLESGERRLTDASVIAAEYAATVAAFLERCRTQALRAGIDYALMSTGTPPERALRDYLRQRGAHAIAGHTPQATK